MNRDALDWGVVLAACIAGVPAFGAWIRAELIHAKIKTPSGDPVGHVVERTHDLAAVSAAHLASETTPALSQVVERLNSDDSAPVQVERRHTDKPPPNGEERRHE